MPRHAVSLFFSADVANALADVRVHGVVGQHQVACCEGRQPLVLQIIRPTGMLKNGLQVIPASLRRLQLIRVVKA